VDVRAQASKASVAAGMPSMIRTASSRRAAPAYENASSVRTAVSITALGPPSAGWLADSAAARSPSMIASIVAGDTLAIAPSRVADAWPSSVRAAASLPMNSAFRAA